MKKMKMFLIVAGILCTAQVCSAATIVSDDFSTNPLASRWTATEQGGTYPWFWTETSTPPVINGLPAADPLSMYTFSNGWKRMMTKDTTSVTQSYTVSTDFKVKGYVDTWWFGQYAQRQGTDPAQCWDAGFYVGGDGSVLPQGKYSGGGWSIAKLGLDRWYTLVTSVNFGAGSTDMQSQVVDTLTQAVIYSTAVYSDSSSTRPMDSKGFGFYAGLDGYHYWGQAVLADNFKVDVVPEPATMALLGLGMLMFRRK